MELPEINTILSQFSLEATSFKDVSENGYSGALIFIITTANGQYVLKGYQTSVEPKRVNFIHEVMDVAFEHGFTLMPQLMKSNSGEFTFFQDNRCWEVMTVIRGKELTGVPNITQCRELGKRVAELHKSLSHYPSDKALRIAGFVTFESLQNHLQKFHASFNENRELFDKIDATTIVENFINTVEEILNKYFVAKDFDELQKLVPRIMLHRDLWNANIFFEGNILTGIIDFVNVKHGARIDDIAKMIIEVTTLSEVETTALLRSYNEVWAFTVEEQAILFQWVTQWLLFSPIWHIEQYISQVDTRTRFIDIVNDAQKILNQLISGKLDYLKEGQFLK